MSATHVYDFHSLLVVRSELDCFPASLAVPDHGQPVHLSIRIINDAAFYESILKRGNEVMPGAFFLENEESVVFKIPFLGYPLYLAVEGFESDNCRVSLSSRYVAFSRHVARLPLASFFPLNHFLKLLLNGCLLRRGAVLQLAAGLRVRDRNLLISAFGGMGKTSLVRLLMQHPDTFFLSDDTVLLHDGQAFSYAEAMRERISKNVFVSKERYLDPTHCYRNRRLSSFFPDAVLLLEHGPPACVPLSTESGLARLLTVNTKVLPVAYERVTAALAYCFCAGERQQSVLMYNLKAMLRLVNANHPENACAASPVPVWVVRGTLEQICEAVLEQCNNAMPSTT